MFVPAETTFQNYKESKKQGLPLINKGIENF
jgi:hypothetical protein